MVTEKVPASPHAHPLEVPAHARNPETAHRSLEALRRQRKASTYTQGSEIHEVITSNAHCILRAVFKEEKIYVLKEVKF